MAHIATTHKANDAQGYTFEPRGYIVPPAPPKDWSVVIDGHTITPQVIQKVLRRSHDAGVDMWYVAQRLGVGSGAIGVFLTREASIPKTLAKRFYELFTSDESLPKVPEREQAWQEEPKEATRKSPTFADRPHDFDAQALGMAVHDARCALQWSKPHLAYKAKCSETYVSFIEDGRVNYKLTRPQPLFRICAELNVDITKYECNPRVDFAQFQRLIRVCVEERKLTWPTLSNLSGVPLNWIRRYLSQKRPRAGVSYLDSYVTQVMAALELDLNEILLTKKEVGNGIQH